MSQAPIDQETTHGFEPPYNTQFSIFLDNRVGKLFDLMDIFQGQALTVAGFSVVDSADHAVVRLLTSKGDLARRLLKRHNHAFSEAEILCVELTRGRDLTDICRCLLSAELNIHYAYPLLVRPRGFPVIALHTDDRLLASQILRRKLFTVFAENDLGENAPGSHPGTPNSPDPSSN